MVLTVNTNWQREFNKAAVDPILYLEVFKDGIHTTKITIVDYASASGETLNINVGNLDGTTTSTVKTEGVDLIVTGKQQL